MRPDPVTVEPPRVLFIDDVARALGTSVRTVARARRAGTFPIPELPVIDRKPRWSSHALQQFLSSGSIFRRDEVRARRAAGVARLVRSR